MPKWDVEMKDVCDIAIVGAGPYGISLAAHLSAAGVDFRIFGKPLDTWRDHMPRGMSLKSDGFASSLSAPVKNSTLKAYCAERAIPYADRSLPVPLGVFVDYSAWFQARFAPMLEDRTIVSLEQSTMGFRLTLDDGEICHARQIVLAVGITWFKHLPALLSALPRQAVSHSYDHHDVSGFKNREVIVLGAGASAIDLAAALDEAGAKVRIVSRAPSILFHDAPDAAGTSLLRQLKHPSSGIGPGWHSFIYANAPLLFHLLPEYKRLSIVKRHLGPAPGWFMRQRVEERIPVMTSHEISGARLEEGKVALDVVGSGGTAKTLHADHVIAATGYRPDLGKLPFLTDALRAEIDTVENTPVLTDMFESSLPGLYFIGPAAASSFGPLMRFMVGAQFVAPRLASPLKRKMGASPAVRAA